MTGLARMETGTIPVQRSASALLGVTNHVDIRSLASVTGRVGYAWGRFLGYVKGAAPGCAMSTRCAARFLGGVGLASPLPTKHRGGWTVGIGGEYAFLDWLTGFAEYDYYGFGTKTTNFNCTGASGLRCIRPHHVWGGRQAERQRVQGRCEPQVRRRRRLRLLGRLPASPDKSGA